MTDLSSGSEQLRSLNARGVDSAEHADTDPQETAEWLEALDAVVAHVGRDRAQFLFDKLASHALSLGVESARTNVTPYQNTIPFEQQPRYPGNLELEERLAAALRWNALAMVVRANQAYGELGGHIASYASAADLFEVGFNHFFRAAAPSGKRARATSCTSSRIRRRACMRGLTSKAFSRRRTSSTTVARSAARACVRIRIRG